MWRTIRILLGIAFCMLGIFGCVYSIRVTKAQRLYYLVEYGDLTNAAPNVVESTCAAAYDIYPHNFNVSARAARTLWLRAFSSTVDDKASVIDQTEFWCDRGLIENPYSLSLKYRKAELISLSSANDAADYWTEFVDWQFWSSQNLSILVKYYARAGRLVEAAEVLSLLKGHPDYKKSSMFLRKAWAAEMKFQ